jgi:hypothetical protein
MGGWSDANRGCAQRSVSLSGSSGVVTLHDKVKTWRPYGSFIQRAQILQSLRGLDGLLRGKTSDSSPGVGGLVRAIFVLGGFYGVCMGLFATVRGGTGSGWQMVASAVKIPLLFLLTLAVTFPSLYVLSALSRSPLQFQASLRMLIRSIAVSIVLLASFGPITAFFTLSTSSYPFMVLLNVAVLTAAGIAGLRYLAKALESMFAAFPEGEKGSYRSPDNLSRTLRVWVGIYGAVGAQMAWILRPFIGSPELPFALFRDRESNFFVGVMESVFQLFG